MKLSHISSLLMCAVVLTPKLGAQTHMPVYTPVICPVIPKSVSICGQTVSLDPVDYAERYDRELTSLIYGHSNMLLMIKRANRYFPQLAPILKANGMPTDLMYLACAESALNPRAVSPAKAAGMWQFMPATAREFGLEVDDEVDQRFDIEKSTEAACRYFKTALNKYNGDWTAVFEAYNGGMGRVSSQIEAQDTDRPLDLYLPEETQRYPFRIMAIKSIMDNPRAFGYKITPNQLYTPREVDVVEVSGPVSSWVQWAKEHGITYLQLRDENPWIRADKLTNKQGKTYRVRVPRKSSLLRSTAKHDIYNNSWTTK